MQVHVPAHETFKYFQISVLMLLSLAIYACSESNTESIINPETHQENETFSDDIPVSIPQKNSLETECTPIEGIVLGDPIPGKDVYLFKVDSFEYEHVMQTIRSKKPVSKAKVNDTKGFYFPCLSAGLYAVSMPEESFEGYKGSPLPYEFNCKNFSLKIAFQGGDYYHFVGVFNLSCDITDGEGNGKGAALEIGKERVKEHGPLYIYQCK